MTANWSTPILAPVLKDGKREAFGRLGSASQSGSGDIINKAEKRETLPKCFPEVKTGSGVPYKFGPSPILDDIQTGNAQVMTQGGTA